MYKERGNLACNIGWPEKLKLEEIATEDELNGIGDTPKAILTIKR